LQAAIQNDRFYDDTEDQILHINFEPPIPSASHAEDEGAVTASLWDIFDPASTSESWDTVGNGINGSSNNGIWSIVYSDGPADVLEFYSDWINSSNGYDPEITSILQHHQIDPDSCPDDPNKVEPGICGCGVSDVDSDGDGTADCLDQCPQDPNKIETGICGCGVADTDSDGDGYKICEGDCNDDEPSAYQGASEICDDGIDNDCDGWDNLTPTVDITRVMAAPVQIGETFSVFAEFANLDENDTNFADCDWQDGSELEAVEPDTEIQLQHAYSEPGVYAIELTVSDGYCGSSSALYRYVVAYDPNGGFVNGHGRILSEPGWCQLNEKCENADGKAKFGFVSKYKKGAAVPIGKTEFNFPAGGLDFHSTQYEWLVVTGSNYAMFKGSGTINGMAAPNDEDYKFMLWAGDGESDTFRIKIWWEDGNGAENLIYDNGLDKEIGGGSIVIHTKSK
jgi:hypothetical protein